MDGPTYTDEEWDEYFGDHLAPEPRTPSSWRRWIAGIIVAGVLLTGLAAWVRVIDLGDSISDAEDIRTEALAMVEESPWAWLVDDVRVDAITNIDIGGYVQNSPPDGVIFIDRRPWDRDDLEATVAHEIGHLIDFAAFPQSRLPVGGGDQGSRASAIDQADRPRGGLATEVWAECAAVDAGFRDTDDDDATQTYRCTDAEYLIFRATVTAFGDVCRQWGEPTCRTMVTAAPR